MLLKAVLYFGKPAALVCDGRCEKAWGLSDRPRLQHSDEDDDYTFLGDNEISGYAPTNGYDYEGGDTKPTDYADTNRQNKWCARQCERCSVLGWNGQGVVLEKSLIDMKNPTPNMSPD